MCFLPGPTKKFSLQNGEKIEEKNWTSFVGQKFPCASRATQTNPCAIVYVALLHFFCFSFLLDVDLGIFSLIQPKNFLSKMERKLKGKIGHHFWTKMSMCNCTWPCLRCSSSFFIFYLFLSSQTLPLLPPHPFFGQASYVCSVHIYIFSFDFFFVFFFFFGFFFM